MEVGKLTVKLNAEVLGEWNSARRRRGLTQKQALEQMMKEWCHPTMVEPGKKVPKKFMWKDLLNGV